MSKNTEAGDDIWVLDRFASKGVVRGGFSKLLKNFERIYKPKIIYSFADRNVVYSKSNVYTKNGFVVHSKEKYDYMYVVGDRRVHKFNFRKDRFKSLGFDIDGKTEKELAKEAKIYRIWDVGKICYIKYID